MQLLCLDDVRWGNTQTLLCGKNFELHALTGGRDAKNVLIFPSSQGLMVSLALAPYTVYRSSGETLTT